MKRIAVSSFKGGTAKTSTTLNVGAAFARFFKKKTLLIDFDAQANLTTGLGFDPDSYESLAPVLQGEKPIDEVILQTSVENLDLIPGDTWLERVEVTGNLAADRYSHERLGSLLNGLNYDIVIIDTPPSLCWLTESAMIASDFSLVCATPEFYSVKGLQRLSLFIENLAERHPLQVLGVALSFWNPRGKSNEAFMELINETFADKLLTSKVRRDVQVLESSIHGKPIFDVSPKSRAAEDYQALAKELLDRMKTLPSLHEVESHG